MKTITKEKLEKYFKLTSKAFKEVKKNIFNISKNKIRIMISTLGNDAGILGAGWLALKGIS